MRNTQTLLKLSYKSRPKRIVKSILIQSYCRSFPKLINGNTNTAVLLIISSHNHWLSAIETFVNLHWKTLFRRFKQLIWETINLILTPDFFNKFCLDTVSKITLHYNMMLRNTGILLLLSVNIICPFYKGKVILVYQFLSLFLNCHLAFYSGDYWQLQVDYHHLKKITVNVTINSFFFYLLYEFIMWSCLLPSLFWKIRIILDMMLRYWCLLYDCPAIRS